MTHRLTTNYAKKYCNRTLIVKVIVENVVTCFLGHGVHIMCKCNTMHGDITGIPTKSGMSLLLGHICGYNLAWLSPR